MTTPPFTESTVEEAALAWLESLGWAVKQGLEIAPGEPFAERQDYRQVVLPQRLRDALVPKLIHGKIRVKDAEKFLQEGGL